MKTKFSLAAKNALSYFALFLVTMGLIAFFIFKSSSREIIQASERNLIHTSELIKLQFSKFLTELKYDITHVSQSPLLYEYIETEDYSLRDLLNKEYLSLLKSKPHFSQIRYIGVDELGKEIIRVERINDSSKIVGEAELQNKGNREYYLSTISLPADSIYISPIDLNKEFGKLSMPYVPTLRMAYPVYFKGRLDGVIVINTNLSELFQSLKNLTDENSDLSLIDSRGFYVFNNDKTLEFEFEFDKAPSFIESYNMLPAELIKTQSDVLDFGEALTRFEEAGFPKADYDIFIQLEADKSSLLAGYYQWRNNSLLILLALGLLSLILAILLMRRQVRELKNITETIDSFPSKLERIELPVNRNDEIGVLTHSFNKMSDMILDNINELQNARDKAEQAVNEKQEFLENMSHEIRNPIHSIIGLSDLLYKNDHLPHQDKLIESIRLNTINLQTLVTDVLDYRNVLNKDIVLNPSWHNLYDELENLYKIFSYSASVKKIKLHFQIDQALRNKQYHLDITRLTQVLTNLLSNGIKYTSENGNVNFEVKSIKSDKGREQLYFVIKDTGRGISPEDLDKIKKRYFRSDKDNPAQDSFGLGLSIVVGLLDLFGSSLELHSTIGQGSEFAFQLELDPRASDLKIEKIEHDLSKFLFKNLKLLVIEDDRQIEELYKFNFDNLFSEVKIINTDEKLETLPPDEVYDIIISDYQIVDRKLSDFMLQINKLITVSTLFYVVSASPKEQTELRNLMYRHIQKPFLINDLINTISFDLCKSKFEVPDLSSIHDDYDGNRIKYDNALRILVTEWEDQKKEMLVALSEKHKAKVDAIIHKMITSVRRLKLNRFESFLLDIQSGDVKNYLNRTEEFKHRMVFYISYIRQGIL